MHYIIVTLALSQAAGIPKLQVLSAKPAAGINSPEGNNFANLTGGFQVQPFSEAGILDPNQKYSKVTVCTEKISLRSPAIRRIRRFFFGV